MNKLEIRLQNNDSKLFGEYQRSREVISPLLEEYRKSFPEFPDHSIKHSDKVSFYISEMLNNDELDHLNNDEVYILLMACLLHDIGMGIPEDKLETFVESRMIEEYLNENPDKNKVDFIRENHHNLSYKFTIKEYKDHLNIPSEIYAEAIALVSMAHRKVDLLDFSKYPIKHFVKSGAESVCLPYLGCLIRIGDELDITDERISELVLKYYYPKNEVSQLEIEKHKANILVNFDDENVIITAKCSNSYVYDAVIQLYKKIQKELDYCQKVIQLIRKIEYSLRIKKIKKEIKTVGFIPKEIGFSFELKNIFKYFIGKNIYYDKFVAIREALQNAIDTCRYKSFCIDDYEASIKVVLNKNYLKIIDNGLGMNEFIVREYFSKLASSYYQVQKLNKNYESIAAFGIGIFSYFLICKSFEVNTRMKDEAPIRFEVYDDYQLNFHFFDANFRNDEGTEITFHLKEEYKDELSLQKLIKIFRYYIRNIEIPITVISEDNSEVLPMEDYILIREEEISELIKPIYQDKISSLTINAITIKNKEFEGVLGIILPVNEEGEINFTAIRKFFINYEVNLIDVSYKGIFVESFDRGATIFKFLLGKMNILHHRELNIGRNRLLDQSFLIEVIEKYELALLEKISNLLKRPIKKEQFLYSNRFFINFLSHYSIKRRSNNIKQILRKILYVELFEDNKFEYFSFEKVLLENKNFIIIPISEGSLKKERKNIPIFTKIYNKYKLPIVLGHKKSFDYIFSLIDFEKIEIQLFSKEHPVLIFCNNLEKNIKRQFVYLRRDKKECIEFQDNFITSRPFHMYEYYNLNHPIIKFWLEHSDQINRNELLKDIFYELDLFLARFYNHGTSDSYLERINNLLSKVNDLYKVNLILNNEDLPFHIISYLRESLKL